MNTGRSLITALELRPHPEGGWYREVFRSADRLAASALPERYLGSRACLSTIYFLLQAGEVSHFHRLRSDEVWHFCDGSPLTIHLLHPDGTAATVRLGRDLRKGEMFLLGVPRGTWMGAEGHPGAKSSLVGCTVGPGFDFADFELGESAELLSAYSGYTDIIQRPSIR
jgi:predicted cupin superfamily sugar epimerase